MRKFGIILACLALAGCCGFKMRGQVEIPAYLRTVCITPYEPYEPTQRAIRDRLLAHNVKIVTQTSPTDTILYLDKATSSEQTLAIGSSGEVQRYKLSLRAAFKLAAKNGPTIEREIIRSRELNRSNNMLLSNEGEEQIVKRELLNEIVNEIMRQITAVKGGS